MLKYGRGSGEVGGGVKSGGGESEGGVKSGGRVRKGEECEE